MNEFCPICGEALVEGVCPNASTHFKPMCINCHDCVCGEDGVSRCFNEENKAKAYEKVKSLGEIGYEVELRPLPLKTLGKKCKEWTMNTELVVSTLLNLKNNE